MVGRFVRHRHAVEGIARVALSRPDPALPYRKVSVSVENATAWAGAATHRDDVMGHSLIAVHTMLAVDDGTFVSLLDPSEAAAPAAAACRSDGAYPVLIGHDDVILSSPIILYDYPKIAPESEGDFFDGTEMDEMLTLRVLTLTDAEKQEMQNGDPRARRILERTEALTSDAMLKAHGVIRGLRDIRGDA